MRLWRKFARQEVDEQTVKLAFFAKNLAYRQNCLLQNPGIEVLTFVLKLFVVNVNLSFF